MNVGDKVAVSIQGHEVVQAEVKEVSDGTATLIIPATRVVMAVKTELAPEVTAAADTSGTEHIVDEVVRVVPEATDITPGAVENASGDVVTTSNTDPQNAGTPEAEKVITSSSVPADNDAAADKAKFEALDPKVQEQILAIVAEHNAASQQASDEAPGD